MPENLRKPEGKWERLEAGRLISIAACSSCHSLTDTGIRPIAKYFPAEADAAGIKDWLSQGSTAATSSTCRRCPCLNSIAT